MKKITILLGCFQSHFLHLIRLKVSQDVPKYMMVTGERAELRGLNLEGLRRRGFTAAEVGIK